MTDSFLLADLSATETVMGPTAEELLLLASVEEAWATLATAASSDPASLEALLVQVFGSSDPALIELLASGGGLQGLNFAVASAEEMNGALGAYAVVGADGTETIYLSETLLSSGDNAAILAVLLEEIGHALDTRLNGGADTIGDEGELFAQRVLGNELSDVQLAAIQADVNSATLTIDGVQVNAETSIESTGISSATLGTALTTQELNRSQASAISLTLTYNAANNDGADLLVAAYNGNILIGWTIYNRATVLDAGTGTATATTAVTFNLAAFGYTIASGGLTFKAWQGTAGGQTSVGTGSDTTPVTTTGTGSSVPFAINTTTASSTNNTIPGTTTGSSPGGTATWTNTSTVDLTPPTFVSAATNDSGTRIILTYSEPLGATTYALPSAFTVTVAGLIRSVDAVSVFGSTVVLTLSSAVTTGQALTVAYSAPASDPQASNNAIQDAIGNDAASIGAQTPITVTNNVGNLDATSPTRLSASTSADGTKIILTYNELLSEATASSSNFVVQIGANPTNLVTRAVSSVSVSGSTVELTIDGTAIAPSQYVTVAYSDPSAGDDANAIQDVAGNDANTFSAINVANSVSSRNASTVTLTGSAVNEGGNATISASVDNSPQGSPLVLTLSNGQTITIAAGSTTGSVTFAVQGDDPYIDGATTTVSIISASGGNYSSLITSSTAALLVSDTTDTTTVTLSDPTVAEGGDVTISATVGSAVTGSPLVLTLSNGQTITIGVGQTTGSVTYTNPNGEDVYTDGGTATVTISSTSGGNYEALNTSDSSVVTTTDTTDTTTVTLSDPTVAEGGDVTISATVGSAVTGSPLVLTLSNGQTITIGVGQTTGSVTYTNPNGEDVYTDGGTATVTISSTSGGNYEALNTSDSSVVTTTDTTDTTTVTLSDPTVAEGGDVTISATVGSAVTGSPLVLTLSNGQTITIGVGQTTGSVTYTNPNGEDVYTDGGTATVTISSTSGGNYEALNTSDSSVVTTTDTTDTTTVTLSDPTVAEGGDVTISATVGSAVTGSPLVLTLSNGQTITIGVGQTTGSVTYTNPNGEDVYTDGGTATVTISSTSGGNYEALNTSDSSVVTTTDTTDTTTVTLSDPTVAEGGDVTISATVGSAVTGSPLVLTLSNGQTITIGVGQTTGSVTYTNPNGEDVYTDGGTATVTISSTSGGNYEALNTSDSSVVTTTDTTDTTTVTLSDPTVAEGGDVTISATVGSAVTGSPLVLTLSNGQTITIGVGQTTGSVTYTNPNGEDVYTDGGTATVTISSTSGGNYEALNTSDSSVVTTTDTTDTTTVTLSDPTVAEGGDVTISATVGSAVTGSPLVLTLSNGQTITIGVGQTTGSVTYTNPNGEDVYTDGGTATVTISSTSGGNYEALNTSDSSVVTTTDTTDTTTVTLSDPTVAEGGDVTISATVGSAVTGSPLVLTLSNGQTITIGVGQTTGSVTYTNPNGEDVYTDGGTATVTISSTSGGNYEALNTSDSSVVTTTDTTDTTTVTLSDPTVAEGGDVTISATVGSAVTGSPLVLTLSNGQTITIGVGQTTGSVTYTNPNGEDVYTDGGTATVTISSTSGGNYEALNTSDSSVVTTTDTTDTTTVTLSDPTVAEGGDVTISATVGSAVTGSPLVLTLSNGQTITIGVGQTTGSVTYTNPNGEDVYTDGGTATVTISSTSGGNYEALNTSDSSVVTTTDTTDTTTVTLSDPTVAEGGDVTISATVGSAVTGSPLVLTLSNGQTITIGVGQTTGSVTYTNPNGEDVYTDGGTATVTISSTSGGNYEALNTSDSSVVTTTDTTDTTDTTTVTLSDPTVAEGGDVTISATVGSAVTGSPLVLTLSNGQTITIGVGQTTGSVTYTNPNGEDVYTDGGTATVTISSTSGGNYEALNTSDSSVVTTTDTTDTTTVTLSDPTVAEGGDVTISATVGSAVTGSPLVLTLSNGQTITIGVGQTTGSVTYTNPNGEDVYTDGGTATVTISSTSGGNYEALNTSDSSVVTTTDTTDTTTVTLSDPTVAEGGDVTISATVGSAVTGSPLVLTLSNGQTITIGVGQTTGSVTYTNPNGEDVYTDGGTATVTISSTSGGNYEALNTSDSSVVTTTDTTDTTTVTLSDPTVAEGGDVTISATVGSAVTGSPLVLTLSNGQTITIGVGQTTGSVTYTNPNGEDVYTDGGTATVTISSTSGGNYEALNTSDSSVVTTTDTTDTTTVTLSDPTVAEGGDVTISATVGSAVTGSPLVLTLSNGQTITIGVGQTTGSVTYTNPNGEDVYTDGGTATVTISSTSGGNYEALNTSDSSVVTTTDTTDTTTVTLSDPTVAEGGDVTISATVGSAVTGSPLVLTLSNGQTITIGVGQTTGSVTYTNPNGEDVYTDGGTATVTISSTSGGNYEALNTSDSSVVTTTDTTDTTTVTLSDPTVAEGGDVTISATVGSAVTGSPLVLTLSNGQTITIGVGQTTGSVTYTNPNGEDVYTDGGTATVTISSTSGGNYEALNTSDSSVVTTTDTTDTTTVTLTGSATVSEDDGVLTIDAEISNPAAEQITITLNDGKGHILTIVIPKDGKTGFTTFTAAASEFNYLAVNETETLAFDVSFSDNSFEQLTYAGTYDVIVTGVNDGVTITLAGTDATGQVTEDLNVASGNLVDTGVIVFNDLDLTDTHTAEATPALSNILGGSLTMGSVSEGPTTESGTVGWIYTVDNSSNAVQYLALGESETETFTVTIADNNGGSTTQTVTVNVFGTNDGPDISVQTGDKASQAFAELTSAPSVASAGLSASGTLTVRDKDTTNTVTITKRGVAFGGSGDSWRPSAFDANAALAMLTLSNATNNAAAVDAISNFGWSFDSGTQGFDYLAAGETQEITYTIEATDTSGATDTQTVVITVTGTNDLAQINGTSSGFVFEKGGYQNNSYAPLYTGDGPLNEHPIGAYATATGQLTVIDLDHDQALFAPVSNQAGVYGSFSMTATGLWTYTLSETAAVVEALGKGDTRTESFLVYSKDGTASQTVTIVVNGADDAARVDVNSATTATVNTRYSNRLGQLEFTAFDVDGPASAISTAWSFQELVNGQWIERGTDANASPGEVIVSLDAGTYGESRNLRFAPSTINGNTLRYSLMGTADLAVGSYRIVGSFTDADGLITTSEARINITAEDLKLNWKGSAWVGAGVKAMTDAVSGTVFFASQLNETDLQPGGLTQLAQRVQNGIYPTDDLSTAYNEAGSQTDFYINFRDKNTNTIVGSTLAAGDYYVFNGVTTAYTPGTFTLPTGAKTFNVSAAAAKKVTLAISGNGRVTGYMEQAVSLASSETSRDFLIATEVGGKYYQRFNTLDDTVVTFAKTAMAVAGGTGNIDLSQGTAGQSLTIGSGANAKTVLAGGDDAVSFSSMFNVQSNKAGSNLKGKLLLNISSEYDLLTGIKHADGAHSYVFTTNAWQTFGMGSTSSGGVIQYANANLIGKANGIDTTTGLSLGGNLNVQISLRDWDVGTDPITGTYNFNNMAYQSKNGGSAALAASYSNQTDQISISLIDATKGNSLFQTNGFWNMDMTSTVVDPSNPEFTRANVAMSL